MGRNLFWLSDEQWARIEPHLPTDVRGVERADDRRVISGIVHVLKCGCRWCDCPEAYGPPTTIYNRFVRWARRGIWENLFRELARNGRSADTQMIDSTHVKAHRSAAGGKGGSRSRLLAARAEGATRRFTHSQMLILMHRRSAARQSALYAPPVHDQADRNALRSPIEINCRKLRGRGGVCFFRADPRLFAADRSPRTGPSARRSALRRNRQAPNAPA